MAIKELKTRIQLKYDSYANWTNDTVENQGANLVLLKGELGICEVQASNEQTKDANIVPTVLFKVGNGTDPFKSLPWASAKAADVYGWAKASDVVLEGKTIKFVGTNKTVVLNYATPEEVKAITDPLAARVTALEGKFGTDGDVAVQLADHESRLDIIEGEGAGSIKKAAADAQAAAEATAAGDATSKANAAEAAAKKHADDLNTAMDTRVDTLEAAKTAQDTKNGELEKAISDEENARKQAIEDVTDAYEAADAAIEEKIGGAYTKDATVHAAIVAAQKAADDAQADHDELVKEGGRIALAEAAISENAGDIEQLGKDLAAEVSRATGIEADHKARIEKMEAFFEGAAEDSEGLNDALDKLVDIQNVLNGDGEAAGNLIGRVADNEEAIIALQDIVKDGGTLEVRVDQAEADINAVEGRATTLEDIVNGYTAKGSIKEAIEAAQGQADKGVEDAGKAQEAADKAQEEIDALELVVGDANSGLVQLVNTVKTTADGAAADTADLKPRMKAAEDDIDALQAIVSAEGGNSNAQLRSDIEALEAIVVDGENANATLRSDLGALDAIVAHETTGLAATKAIADEAKTDAEDAQSRVAAIEGDYLKAADEFIFNCGSSSLVVHKPENN